MKQTEDFIKSLGINLEMLQQLKTIGGHKVYHLEGDAYTHTLLVMAEALKIWPADHFMIKVALLHDIGKLYTSICHGENNWEYPDHAQCGSFRGVLCKFIPEKDFHFRIIQWYLANHIKPLYWKGEHPDKPNKVYNMSDKEYELCTMDNLRKLALCDIRGSQPVQPQTTLISYLEGLQF